MPPIPSRRRALKLLTAAPANLFLASAASTPDPEDTFAVFGLLHPTELRVSALGNTRPRCAFPNRALTLEPTSSLSIDAVSTPMRLAGPSGQPIAFLLEIAQVIRRAFFGRLEIISSGDLLLPIVEMPREVAVSSIACSELPSTRAPLEALAAQAVVARSFLAGTPSPRHRNARFCDTTHCQFLRSPAPALSKARQATIATRGVVLLNDGRIFPALYSASCGGRTEEGERDGFLYRSAPCEICRRANLPRSGHGWGLCQEGAIGLAKLGWTWQAILQHYYAGAALSV